MPTTAHLPTARCLFWSYVYECKYEAATIMWTRDRVAFRGIRTNTQPTTYTLQHMSYASTTPPTQPSQSQQASQKYVQAVPVKNGHASSVITQYNTNSTSPCLTIPVSKTADQKQAWTTPLQKSCSRPKDMVRRNWVATPL